MVSDRTHLRTLAFRRRNFDSRRAPRKIITKPVKQRPIIMIKTNHKLNGMGLLKYHKTGVLRPEAATSFIARA